MGVPGSANPLLLAQQDTGYRVQRSIRLNSSDSAFCSRVFSSAGNRKTWTFSAWVKRAGLGIMQYIFDCSGSGVREAPIRFTDTDNINIANIFDPFTGVQIDLVTTAVYRDVSAWYHIVVAFDTTQATASDRIKLYVNGSQVTAFSATTYPAQNTDYGINSAVTHYIGRYTFTPGRYLSAYLAEIHFIDGQALTPSSFTEVSATTGQLIPKAYTGSYGTNGFKLDFADNSAATAAALGKDTSGNGNNWTPTNLSVTAGSGNDSLVDTPTSYGTGESGGDVRGNFCTLNPLTAAAGFTLSNGNLEISSTSASVPVVLGTIAVNSGKWYWEVTLGTTDAYAGAATITSRSAVSYLGAATGQFIYNTAAPASSQVNGSTYNYSTASACSAGDVIGVALNFDSNTITFYRNGVSQGTFSSNVLGTDTWAPAFKSNTAGASATFNFGQRPFAYPVSGFKALCDTNLPSPQVAKPSTVFDTKLYTGNGSTQNITGLGFSPDLVWIKMRSKAYWHELNDTVRGPNKSLFSNATDAESTINTLTAFNSDGFTVGVNGGANGGTNESLGTYVAWAWDGGSSTVTNTQGSITSSVRANASAGFSIVSYTGNGSAGATVGHGLGVKPSLLIIKQRSAGATNWAVYHSAITALNVLQLNTTSAQIRYTASFNDTEPTSTVFSLGTDAGMNGNTSTYVCYAFAPVAGHSSFGSYTGNGSADGPFVYTGFRPRWILIKNTSATGFWILKDTARDPANTMAYHLAPNASDADYYDLSLLALDSLSNGFKVRNNNSGHNTNSNVYVYAAFAEFPFQYARAR